MAIVQTFRPTARISSRSIKRQEIFQSEQCSAIYAGHQFRIQALERPLVFILQYQFAVLHEDAFHDGIVIILVAYAQIGIELLLRIAVRQGVRELLIRFQQRVAADYLYRIHRLLYIRQRTERRYGRTDVEPVAQESRLLQIIAQPHGGREGIVSMVFLTFLEPGTCHSYTARIAEVLYLALHLEESGCLRLVHLRSGRVGTFILILCPHLIVAGTAAQLHLLEVLFIDGFANDGALVTVHQCLDVRQRCVLVFVLLVFPVVLGMDERSRHIHLDALLMGQGMLEVKVERRRVAGCVVVDVRIDGLRAAHCPHLVQFILVGGIAEVVTEDGIEYIFVRFRQIVRQIQVVDEAQRGRLVFDAFLDAVDGAVAQIEGFVGFEAAVILAVLVEVVDAPFGVLVIELRAQKILSP